MKRNFIQLVLVLLSKLVLWRYHPLVVAVVGSSGKTSTKEAIAAVLKDHYRVRQNSENQNVLIGVCLTIIGGQAANRNIWLWLKNFWNGVLCVFWKQKNYPEILVLEMSEDQPGSLKYLIDLCQPHIGVITWIGKWPVHLSNFKNKDELLNEIYYLAKLLPNDGILVLNSDNKEVLETKSMTQAQVITFGFKNGDVKIDDYKLYGVMEGNRLKIGSYFRLFYSGSYLPVKIIDIFGKPQIYALTAASCVGLKLKLNLLEIVEKFKNYHIPCGRTTLLAGSNNFWILDDSYNSNPDAVYAALELLREIANISLETDKKLVFQKKIAVLGDMLELGEMREVAHRTVGKWVAESVDIFVAIGQGMKLAAEVAKPILGENNIFVFGNSQEAALKIKEIVKAGDLILVKGSRGMHLEIITKALMLEPEKAEELLIFADPV